MSDPWKRQVIWQNLIEKETLFYAGSAGIKISPGSQEISADDSSTFQEDKPKVSDVYADFKERVGMILIVAVIFLATFPSDRQQLNRQSSVCLRQA